MEHLLEYLRTDAVEIVATELDATASIGAHLHEAANVDNEPELQAHAAVEPSKSALREGARYRKLEERFQESNDSLERPVGQTDTQQGIIACMEVRHGNGFSPFGSLLKERSIVLLGADALS